MGVISEEIREERDAQGRPASESTTQEQEGTPPANLPDSNDPFLQQYLTDEYDADTETVNQILTAVIAAGNLL